jgi:hypothetical protein
MTVKRTVRWVLFAVFGAASLPLSAKAQVVAAANVGEPVAVIAGRAIVAFNDSPLADAVVYIEETDFTAVADADGFFGLGPLKPGIYRLVLFHPALAELGWVEAPTQLVIVPPGMDVQVDFVIDQAGVMIEAGGPGSEDNPFFLDPLTIVGKRSVFERPLEEGARVDYVGLDDIEAREGGARHIGDLIRNFPSLSVHEPRPGMVCIAARRRTTNTPNPGSVLGTIDVTGGAGINTTRLCPKMVQVYIDDIAIFRAEEMLATISPQNIERVEYVNGVAAGARFGTGYAEGVLLLYTRRPTINKKPN